MTDTLDLDHLRQWIGRTEQASDIVTAQLVKGLRATLFLDIGTPEAGDAAPFTAQWCLGQPVYPMDQLGPDGHPARGGFLPPVPLPRRMWAGGRIEFIDAAARRRRGHRDVEDPRRHAEDRLAAARSCFVTVEHLSTAARPRHPRAAGHRLSRQPAAAAAAAPPTPMRRRRPRWSRESSPIRCCCSATPR